MIPLTMSIIAKTETFQRDMARARGHVGKFEKSVKTTSRAMLGFSRSILALAGVGGLGFMIKRQMEAIDATAKLSDRLGMTTESLVALQHGAKIAGVDTGTLNKSLEIFSRRLGEVDMGVGEARHALEKLGLNYRDLIQTSPDEAIKAVADQINKLSTQAEKAAAANYLFGRSGQQLLNLFEAGSQGIAEYENEVRKLGLSFSRIDAAQVERANDALTRTRAVFTGISRTLTIELSPYIAASAEAFVDWATSGEGAGAKVVGVIEGMTLGLVNFNANVHDSIARMYELADAVTNLDEIMVWLSKHGGSGMKQTYKELAIEQRKLAEQERAAAEQAIEDIHRRMTEEKKWADEKMELNRRLEEVYGPKKMTEQFQEEMDARVEIHAEAIQRMEARESEYAAIVRNFQEQQKYNWVTMWDPVIAGEMKAEEAVRNFFRNFLIQLVQAKAQMAMLGLWNAGAGALLGGFGGAALGYSPNFATSVTNAGVAPVPAVVGHSEGRVGDLTSHRFVSPAIFAGAPRYHDLRPGETAVIAQDDEVLSRPMLGGGSDILQRLDRLISLTEQRQTLNATIIDKRDVVTGERMSGREGERWTMEHVRKNS